MGEVIILPETTRKPITLMGKRAGICWGGDISDDQKNYQRGLDCLKKNHGRVLEFVNIETVFKGWSAKVIREFYTHIGGSPTRLQASTRYIDYHNFDYIIPSTIKNNPKAKEIYTKAMGVLSASAQVLQEDLNISKEDTSMLLPFGMQTVNVDKRNLRNVIDMSHQRKCSRAYWEYRELFNEWSTQLRNIDDEWKYIVNHCFKPKCEVLGYCPEGKPCKNKFRKEDLLSQTELFWS